MTTGRDKLAQYVLRDRKLRFRSRAEFARAAGIGLRTLTRIERAECVDFRESTKARIEAELGWTDGSVDRTIAGGRPGYVKDPELAELTRLWPALSRDARSMLLHLARDARDR